MTNNLWSDFKDGKIYLRVERKDWAAFIERCKRDGLRWRIGCKAACLNPWEPDQTHMFMTHNIPDRGPGLGCDGPNDYHHKTCGIPIHEFKVVIDDGVKKGAGGAAHTFKVGDIVRGKSQACITGKTMKRGKVVELRNWIIVVELIESEVDYNNKMFKGHTFDVLPDDIELVEPANHISRVLYSPPATVVFWSDGTKTVAKCAPHERFDREKGLAIACAKKLLGEGYADAFKEFREPKNRVLSREEVFALKFGMRVWVEYRTGYWSIPTTDGVYMMEPMLLGGEMLRETQTTHEFITLNRAADDGYFGRKYRVWLLPRKPTADELRANPWKREGCE